VRRPRCLPARHLRLSSGSGCQRQMPVPDRPMFSAASCQVAPGESGGRSRSRPGLLPRLGEPPRNADKSARALEAIAG
jgi:hypothetical protein